VINKVTSDISGRDVATKHIAHLPDDNGGVVEMPVKTEDQSRPCVSDEEVKALAAVARRVEKHYGLPQDIEWAIDGQDNILLLQSRPETVWAAKDKAPVAKPTDKAFGHIFNVLGGQRQ